MDKNFLSRPYKDVIRENNVIANGGTVTFNVVYAGCIEVYASMKTLDFSTRSLIARYDSMFKGKAFIDYFRLPSENAFTEFVMLKVQNRKLNVESTRKFSKAPVLFHAWNTLDVMYR